MVNYNSIYLEFLGQDATKRRRILSQGESPAKVNVKGLKAVLIVVLFLSGIGVPLTMIGLNAVAPYLPMETSASVLSAGTSSGLANAHFGDLLWYWFWNGKLPTYEALETTIAAALGTLGLNFLVPYVGWLTLGVIANVGWDGLSWTSVSIGLRLGAMAAGEYVDPITAGSIATAIIAA